MIFFVLDVKIFNIKHQESMENRDKRDSTFVERKTIPNGQRIKENMKSGKLCTHVIFREFTFNAA